MTKPTNPVLAARMFELSREGLELWQIAERFNVPDSTVQQVIHDERKRLARIEREKKKAALKATTRLWDRVTERTGRRS